MDSVSNELESKKSFGIQKRYFTCEEFLYHLIDCVVLTLSRISTLVGREPMLDVEMLARRRRWNWLGDILRPAEHRVT